MMEEKEEIIKEIEKNKIKKIYLICDEDILDWAKTKKEAKAIVKRMEPKIKEVKVEKIEDFKNCEIVRDIKTREIIVLGPDSWEEKVLVYPPNTDLDEIKLRIYIDKDYYLL